MALGSGVRKREREGDKKTPTRTYSKKQEDYVAKVVNGKTTANSGATNFQKGDVLTSGEEAWLIECKTKTTHADSISIKKDWFEKNKQEMAFMGKQHQAIAFNFGPGEEMHYIIDEYLFNTLIDFLKEQHNKN